MNHPSQIEKFAYTARRVTRVLANRDGSTTRQTGGTAFVVAHPVGDKNAGFLVTANHVIWPKLSDRSNDLRRTLSIELESHERSDTSNSEGRGYTPTTIQIQTSDWVEPTEDGVCVARADATSGVLDGGYSSFVNADQLWTRDDFERAGFIGREVIVAGYPDSILPDLSVPRPVISSGVIASDPRWSAEVAKGTNEHSILYQGFSWNGMSGSPVLAKQVGFAPSATIEVTGYLPAAIVGVSFGHIRALDATHSSWSGMFPSWLILDAISEILRGC